MSLAVEAISLTKQFGRIRALDDVSFNIKPGEIYGLIGPNGAGKTTMLRISARYLFLLFVVGKYKFGEAPVAFVE